MSKDTSNENQAKKFALGALIAGLFGYLAGILTAPKSGKETRRDIQDKTSQAVAEAEKQLKRAQDELDELLKRGQRLKRDIPKQAEADWAKATEAAGEAKDRVVEILSALRNGAGDNEDLEKAVKDANDAVTHLKDYLSRGKKD